MCAKWAKRCFVRVERKWWIAVERKSRLLLLLFVSEEWKGDGTGLSCTWSIRLDETEEANGEGNGGDHGSRLRLASSVEVETDSTGRSGPVLSTGSSSLQSGGREEGVDNLFHGAPV